MHEEEKSANGWGTGGKGREKRTVGLRKEKRKPVYEV